MEREAQPEREAPDGAGSSGYTQVETDELPF